MGKIKDKKHRVHFVAPKTDTKNEDIVRRDQCVKNTTATTSNIFKNIHIPASALKQKLPAFTSQAAIETKHAQRNATLALVASRLNLQKKKGGPRKPVHKVVKEVLEEQNRLKKQAKNKKKKILHNYNSLKDALPSLSELQKTCETQEKARNSKSQKIQAIEMEEDIETFRNNLKSATFVSDPFKDITAHIKANFSF